MYINVIVVEKDKKAYLKKLPGTTDSLKKEMNGSIEFVKLSNDKNIVLAVSAGAT